MTGPRVAVIGGGISGLTAARRIRAGIPDAKVVVFERDRRAGGKIATVETDAGPLDAGPDSFLTRDPVVEDLCRELGLADQLEPPAIFRAKVWNRGRLAALPPSLYGLPLSPAAALGAEPLSPSGRIRALGDLFLPGPLRGPDVSVGHFVRRRFGREVLERLVDPLLAGTRAGDPNAMSLAAALPAVDQIARRHRSVMRGAAEQGQEVGAPPFLGLKGGMTRLVTALTDHCGVEIRAKNAVSKITRTSDGFGVAAGNKRDAFRAVIVALPPYAAAPLIEGFAPQAARKLERIEHASAASVSLVYPRGSVDIPADTSGVLIPSRSAETITAVTWTSRKWPGRVSGRVEVVRCFVGRAGRHPALELSDRQLADACAADVAAITGTTSSPTANTVTRWPMGLPQYAVGHLELVGEIEKELRAHPGLALTGAGYRGSGLPDCVRQAHSAADRILEHLRDAPVSASSG